MKMNRGEIVTEIFARGFDQLNETGTNEVQKITVKATAGKFKITFDGQTTAAIAYNATAAQMQTALEALSNVAAEDIVVTGGPGDAEGTTPYVLTYGGQYEETNVPAVTTDVTELTEGTKTAAVTTTTPGVGAGRARVRRVVSQVHRRICDYKPWPFLMKTAEGTAPLKVEDLGHVVAFVDATNDNRLRHVTLGQITRGDPDLSSSGSAAYWYTEDNETLKVYPADTSSTFKAHYRKEAARLVRDSDEPLFDEDYVDVLIDGCVAEMYKLTDNFEAAAAVRADYEDGLMRMVHALMKSNYDDAVMITRTGGVGYYA